MFTTRGRWYLIQSLEVPTASVSRCANVLHRRAEVREVVGQAEGGRQEAGDKHLTDLDDRPEMLSIIVIYSIQRLL